jgi:hypothetical protein
MLSCGIQLTQKSHFTVYKQVVFEEKLSKQILFDGVYIQELGDLKKGFYFYSDGSVKLIYFNKSFYKDLLNETIDTNSYKYSWKERWGHYRIQKDTIKIQIFNYNTQFFPYKRWIMEYNGIVLTDTTVKMFSLFSYLKKKQFNNNPMIYSFKQTNVKPDSTKAWFKNKKWYLENLDESRK